MLRLDGPTLQRVVVSDVEGTLSEGVTWKGLRRYLEAHGREHVFRRFLRRRMLLIGLYQLGLLNTQRFRENWLKDILRMFAGQSEEEFLRVAEWVVENELWPKRRQHVLEQLQDHKSRKHRVLLVSGMIEPMLKLIAERIGVEAIGTPVIFEDGKFTGEVNPPFITGQNKVLQIRHIVPVDPLLAAYGDTAADIPMLTLAENRFAVSPDRKLLKWANAHRCDVL